MPKHKYRVKLGLDIEVEAVDRAEASAKAISLASSGALSENFELHSGIELIERLIEEGEETQ